MWYNIFMLNKLFTKVLSLFSLIIFGLIFCLSLFNNIYKPSIYVATNYHHIYILALLFIALLPYVMNKLSRYIYIYITKSRLIVYALLSLIGLFIIFTFPQKLISDPLTMYTAANYLAKNDITGFLENSSAYFQFYPYQFFYTYLITIFVRLFGNNAITCVSIFQLAIMVLSAHYMYKIIDLLTDNPKATHILSLLLLIWFVPIVYANYLYGFSLGSSFALISLYYFLHYLKMNNGKDLILSCLFIIISICFKLNFSVVLIAYLVINLFQNKSIKHKIIATLLFVASYVLSKNIGPALYYFVIGETLGGGVPILTYFVMGGLPYEGMQRSVQSVAGEWNGYTTSLAAATNIDSKVMSGISFNDFITQIKYILSNPSLAFDFYKNKILYTWSNKDFASLDALINYGVFTASQPTSNSYLLFSNIYILFCNVVHYMVFLCLSISSYKQFKKHNWFSNIFSLIFIGFFVYHLISESKGMYVMPVVYLMIPLVAYEFSTINYGKTSFSKTIVIIGACIFALMFVYNCTRYTVEAYQNNIDDTVTFETIKAGESVTQTYRFSEDIRLDHINYTISSDIGETNSGQYQLYINDSLVDSDTFVTENNEAIITLKRSINKNDTLTLKIINTNSFDLYIQTSSVENELVDSSSFDQCFIRFELYKGLKGMKYYGINYHTYLPVY